VSELCSTCNFTVEENMTLFHKLGDWKVMIKGINEVLPTEELARMWRHAHLVNKLRLNITYKEF